MRLRVLMEPRHGATYDRILAMALATEEAGFDGFFRGDHYLGIEPGDPEYLPTDSWTTLAGLARDTKRVKLGTLVTAATFRRPGVLAVTVATVDQMSGGRVCLGIGTGWYEREHESFGMPFPPIGERFDRLEEHLKVIYGIWTTPPGERFSFEGSHVRIDACANFPALVQRPRPEIIIGGTGPRRTPLLAARYADEFNAGLGEGGPELFFERVRRVCEEVGRDPSTLRMSATLPVACGATRGEAEARVRRLGQPGERLLSRGVVGEPADVVEELERLRGIGCQTVYFHLYDIDDLDHIDLLGREVLPAVSGGGHGDDEDPRGRAVRARSVVGDR
jgi:F420-dependent oxidoreductase-like protein